MTNYHLHSTMLLLYLLQLSHYLLPHLHLHSTMLLLYPSPSITAIFVVSFIYIPLCFYFITICELWPIYLQKIYIPLCFYFIRCLPQRVIVIPYLHSTMLLLYPAHILQNDGWKEIDLHSTMLLLYPVEPYSDYLRILNLHSTMLLLYPERQGTDTRADPEFTFHYASTLSKERRSCHSELLSHLHSTMLLLYRGSCWVQTWSCSEFTFHYASTLSPPAVSGPSGFAIYIPLCFYFIPSGCVWSIWIFNLHSTMLLLYLRNVAMVHTAELHLHSTMLLLYLFTSPLCVFPCLIYIPLCFYFILRRVVPVRIIRPHLHSTMLLLYPVFLLCDPA